MASVHDWQSYQASVLAQSEGGTAILYRPCRELPTRVTDCAPDDSAGDHERVAVISGPGFTGLTVSVFPEGYRSSCLSWLFKSAFTGEKTLIVKGFSRTIPAEYFPEQVSGYDCHGFVPRHLCFIFLFMIKLSVQATFSDQR